MKPSLMIHGGAGLISADQDYLRSLDTVIRAGQKLLVSGASALDTVEHCVMLLEDDPLFNAGKGSVLTHEKTVELDAAIMEGKNLQAGSVAGVKNVKNPIHLARQVLEKSEHVMLIGRGGSQFGRTQGVEEMPDDYFIVPHRVEQLEKAKLQNKTLLDHSAAHEIEKKFGTVGAVAIDVRGNLAAATSTGGIVNKHFGRIGDTPIVGAGLYADNETCAVSATGYGEHFIRTVLSKHIADLVAYKKLSAQEAADEGIRYLVSRVQGLGGVIVIDHEGKIGKAYSTAGMAYAYAQGNTEPVCSLK